MRLGVTGLSRAGKTVFITSLVRNLVVGGRMPFFKTHAEGRILRAFLEPQPDDDVPRFDYEGHLAKLAADPPEWPQSTRHISELRLTIEYQPEGALRRMLGPARLHIDIVDYPGEWLTDLTLIERPFDAWCREALAHVAQHGEGGAAKELNRFLASLTAKADASADPEQTALEGAKVFTAYLEEVRAANGGIATLAPGRFLMPGDLAGSPLLTFFPLPEPLVQKSRALGELLERRYESYKSKVVRPFFNEHFSRIDRQIVLVDALSALNGGARAVADLERGLDGALAAFRPGATSWLASLFSRRIDHLLFAATKADHLHHADHDRLEALLRHVTDRAIARASGAGAEVEVMALAALRATREAERTDRGETLAVIVGTPLPGETIDGRTFDGKTEVAVFPGDLPSDPATALAGTTQASSDVHVVRFRPPKLPLAASDSQPVALPHIRLDRALEFLLGDLIR